MRISVVADVHGNFDALARVAEKSEKLIILGDLLDYVDYHEPTRGILGEMFGEDNVRHFTVLRSQGAFAELRQFNVDLWGSMADPVGVLSGIVQQRYRRVLDSIPGDAVVTLGNVDVAEEWIRVAGDRVPYRDDEMIDIDGVSFAFVAGGVSRQPVSVNTSNRSNPASSASAPGTLSPQLGAAKISPWRPMMRSQQEYRQIVDGLGRADVLCSHIPPDLPLLRYDTVPGRIEMAGPGLTDFMRRVRPQFALFGHVHQPLSARTRYGMTECVNVGHFQRVERPYIIDTERIRAARSGATVTRIPVGR
ncbi:MAG: metallophosphoesterase [Nakamurella sp.]